ncbi:DUF1419 domain-containing protein [Rhizobium ecuadorense]|uniref:DUF1419 domain-containing protein n=1 Tax=Rhizobium ecuadorense TaxID=1671795 RepID=UPI00128EB5FA
MAAGCSIELPNCFGDNATSLDARGRFEIGEHERDSMFDIVSPLWIPGTMIAMHNLTGSVTRGSSRWTSTRRSVISTARDTLVLCLQASFQR